MKITPGPWKFDVGNMEVESENTRQPICEISTAWNLASNLDRINPEESEANAEAIAAVPEMIKELTICRQLLISAADTFRQDADMPNTAELYEKYAEELKTLLAKVGVE